MKKSKRKFRRLASALLAIFLSVLTIMSSTVGAFAWTVDGSGIAGGGGGSGGGKGFGIPGEFATTGSMPIAGMRFSVYNKYSGETLGTIDVFRNTPNGANYITAEKFSMKLNKIQLKKIYNKQTFSTTTSQANCYQASSVASNLPAYASQMKAWESHSEYFKNILLKTVGVSDVNDLSPGDYILVEPLFPLKAHGTTFVMTPTEIAIIGAQEYNGWDSTGPSTSNGGTWGWISHYTNVFYPQAMYLDTTSLPDELPTGWALHTGSGKVTNAEHASFRTIIEKGFGIHIAYQNNQPQWEPPTIETIHETYKFTVVEELYNTSGKLVYTYPKKVKTLTNKLGTSIDGNQIYIPMSHTFSVASEMRGNSITGRLQYNGNDYMISDATLVEQSGNNTGTRTTEISNRTSMYSISGEATLTIRYVLTTDQIKRNFTTSTLPTDNLGITSSSITSWKYLRKNISSEAEKDYPYTYSYSKSDLSTTETFNLALLSSISSRVRRVSAPEFIYDVYGYDSATKTGEKADYYYKGTQVYYYKTDTFKGSIINGGILDVFPKLPVSPTYSISKQEYYFLLPIADGQSYDVFFQYEKVPDEYTINFNANSGTGAMDSIVAKTKEPVQLSKNAFTKDGYDYTGWYLQDDNTKCWYGYDSTMTPGWYPENKLIKDSFGKPWKILVKDEAWLNSTTATITKLTELEDGSTVLSVGSTIAVYNSNGKEIAREVTNDAGKITVNGLDNGEYTYREIKRADGKAPDTTVYTFTVDANGNAKGDNNVIGKKIIVDKRYGSITCFAQWQAQEIYIEYNGNGAVGEMERQTVFVTTGSQGTKTDYSISPNEFYYAGRQFMYWSAAYTDTKTGVTYALGRKRDSSAKYGWQTGWYELSCYEDPQQYQEIELEDGSILWKDQLPASLALQTIIMTAHWQSDFDIQYYQADGDAVAQGDYTTVGNPLLLGANKVDTSVSEQHYFGAVTGKDGAANEELAKVFRKQVNYNGTSWILSDGTKLSNSQTPDVYYSDWELNVSTQKDLDSFMSSNNISPVLNANTVTINIEDTSDVDERGNIIKPIIDGWCCLHIKGITSKNSVDLDMYFIPEINDAGASLSLKLPYGKYTFELVNTKTGSVFVDNKVENVSTNLINNKVKISACFNTDFYNFFIDKDYTNYWEIRYALNNFVLPPEFDGSTAIAYPVINRSSLNQESTSTYDATQFSSATATDGSFNLLLKPKLDFFPDDVSLSGNKAGYKFHIFNIDGNDRANFYVTTDANGEVQVRGLPRGRIYYIESCDNPTYLQCATSTVYLESDTSADAAEVVETVRYDFRLNGAYKYVVHEGVGMFQLTGDSYFSSYDVMGNQSTIPSWVADEELNTDFPTEGVGNTRHEDFDLSATIAKTSLDNEGFANGIALGYNFCDFHYNRENGISLPADVDLSKFTRVDGGDEGKGIYISETKVVNFTEQNHPRLVGYKGYYYILNELDNTIKIVFLTAEDMTNPVTINYDKNDVAATGEMGTQTARKNQTVSLLENGFAKEFYDFVGWYAKDNETGNWCHGEEGTEWASQSTIDALELEKHLFKDKDNFTVPAYKEGGSITLYAQWSPKPYYITYDGNGGVLTEENADTLLVDIPVGYDEQYTALGDLYTKEKSDFAFWAVKKTEGAITYYLGYDKNNVLGWYKMPAVLYQMQPNDKILEKIVLNDGTSNFTLGMVGEHFTLEAQWNTHFTVNFLDSNGNPAFDAWNSYMFMPGTYTDNGAANNAYERGFTASTEYLQDYSHYTSYYGKTQTKATVRFATAKNGTYNGYVNVVPFAYNNNTGISAVTTRTCKHCWYLSHTVEYDVDKGDYICSRCGNVVPPEYNSINVFDKEMNPFDGVNSWYGYKAVVKSPNELDIILYTKPEIVPNYQIHYNKNDDSATGNMPSNLIYVETEDFVTTPTLDENKFQKDNYFYKHWYMHDDNDDLWYGWLYSTSASGETTRTLGWYSSAYVFSNYNSAYKNGSFKQVNSKEATVNYNGSDVTLKVSKDFEFYQVSDKETLTLSKLDGSVTVFAQWQQIPTKFTVEFVDKNGNPAFTSWNSAVRYEYNGTSGLENATGASEKHFADSLIDFGCDGFRSYLLLANKADGTLNLGTTGIDKLYFDYNFLTGVSRADNQKYDEILPLAGNSKWNFYKMSVDEENNKIVVTLYERYTVSYDANGGTGTMPVDTVELDEPYTIRENAFTKDNAEFAGYWLAKKIIADKTYWYGYDANKILGWYTAPKACYKFAEGEQFGASTKLGEIANVGENVCMVAQWNTPFTVKFVDENGNPAFPDNDINSGIQYQSEDLKWIRTQTYNSEQSYFDNYNMDEKTRSVTLFLAKNKGVQYLAGENARDAFVFNYNRNSGVSEKSGVEYDTKLALTNNELWNYYSIFIPSPNEVVVTLYDVHYDIHYNANGGVGTMASQKAWANVDIQLTENQFTKNMSTFDCWYMKDDDTGLWYGYSKAGDETTLGWYEKPAEYYHIEDESTINLPKEEGSVTLYAQWFTDFVVRFVDKDGNPAFKNDFSSGIRYFKKDNSVNYLSTTNATQSYFTEQGVNGVLKENDQGLYLYLANQANKNWLSGDKYRDSFQFIYNKNVGVTENSKVQYDTLLKLKNNTVWNYYKISIPNPNEVVVTLYDLNYKIDYIGNGATSGAMSSSTGYENKDVTLSENKYGRDDFAYRGWYLYDTDENTWYGTKDGVLGWYSSSEVVKGYSTAYAVAQISNVTENNVTFLGVLGVSMEKTLPFDSSFIPYRAKDTETFNFAKSEGTINAYALWAAKFTVSYVAPDGQPAFDNWNNHVTYNTNKTLWTPVGHDAQTEHYNSAVYALDDFSTGQTNLAYAILLNKQIDASTTNGYHLFPFNYNSDNGVSEVTGKDYDEMMYFEKGKASPFENHQWDAYSVSVPDAHNVVITLYDLSYIINYNGNGGDGEMPSQKVHPNADIPLQPNSFTKENFGYRFWYLKDDDTGLWYGYDETGKLGWYKESEIVSYEPIKDGSTLNLPKEEGSVTLYAQWASNFTVEFRNPDGSPAFDSWKSYSTYDTVKTKRIKTGDSTTPVVSYYAPKIIQNELFKTNEVASIDIGLYRYKDTTVHSEAYNFSGLGYSSDKGLEVLNTNLVEKIRAFGAGITFEGKNWNAYKLSLVNEHKAVVTLYDFSYQILFNANGGTGYMEPQSGRYGVDVKLNPNKFARQGYDFVNWHLQDNDTGLWYGCDATHRLGWQPKNVCEQYGYAEIADEATINLLKLQGTVTAYAQWKQNPVEFRVHFLNENGEDAFDTWNSAVRYEKTTTSGLVSSDKATTEYYPSSVGEVSYNTYEAYVSLANHASDDINLSNASSMIQIKFNYNFATGVSKNANQKYNEVIQFSGNEKWTAYTVQIDEATDDIYVTLIEWAPRELRVEYYQPNANYVEDTSVIATFKVTNDTIYAYNPDVGNVTMHMKMYGGIYSPELNDMSGKLIADMTKEFVIPPNKSQNVYFKIAIPANIEYKNITFDVTMTYQGKEIGTYRTITNYSGSQENLLNPNHYVTEIVRQNREQMAKYGYSTVIPMGYKNQEAKDVSRKKLPNVATWDEYLYKGNGVYEKVTYYSYLKIDKGMTEPNYYCPVWWKDTDRNQETGRDGFYNLMRSGYGIDTYYSSAFYQSDKVAQLTGGVACTNTDAFIPAQLSKVYYPENNYGDISIPLKFFDQSVKNPNASYVAQYDTASASYFISRGTNGWIGKKDITESQFNNATRSCFYRLNHFTPMWAKDGDYAVQPVVTNAWTPAGALGTSNILDTTRIDGSIYSDWRWVSGKVD